MIKSPILTWANLITTVGIFLALAALWQVSSGELLGAIPCFALAAISDAVDGYVARSLDRRGGRGSSELGRRLDPLRDRLLSLIIWPLAWQSDIAAWAIIFLLVNVLLVFILAGLGQAKWGVVIPRLSKQATAIEFFASSVWLVAGLSPTSLATVLPLILYLLLVASLMRCSAYWWLWRYGPAELL